MSIERLKNVSALDIIYRPKLWAENYRELVAQNPEFAALSSSYDFASYVVLYDKLEYTTICKGVDTTKGRRLESVGIYQTIDAICEGEVAGLCDKDGELIDLSNANPKSNENGFRGILLNDAPIKNTNSNTLNYARVFADFKPGTVNQKGLYSGFKNPALNFDNACQTLNIGSNLSGIGFYGLGSLAALQVKPFTKTSTGTSTESPSVGWNNLQKAFLRNFAYPVTDGDTWERLMALKQGHQLVAVNHIIHNNEVVAAQVNMQAVISTSDDKKPKTLPTGVNFVIEMGYENDDIPIPAAIRGGGGSKGMIFCGIYGIATSPYERTYHIPLPPSVNKRNRIITIWRLDGEIPIQEGPAINKQLSCNSITEMVNCSLTYPHTTTCGMVFDARSFTQPPRRTFHLKLAKIALPSNYDPVSKSYTGNWDGEFHIDKQWTSNPAWIFYDLAVNKRYGVGKYGFRDSFVDKWNLYTIGKYCDELVPTGYSGMFAFKDFTINSGGVKVTIDASGSDSTGPDWITQFPEGSTVCLFDLKDSAGADIDQAYQRLIYNPEYSAANNNFTFTLLAPINSTHIFSVYPYLKQEYYSVAAGGTNSLTPEQWILNYFLSATNNESDFHQTMLAGEPLPLEVVSGSCGTQFKDNLPILEPRFSCSIYFDRQQNAYKALNDLASIFRGMVYWSSGYLFAANDGEKDAVMLFSNANVIDGVFNYAGSASTTRVTSVIVRYNDAQDRYKPKAEYAEDAVAIREYGYLEQEVIALGCTSQSQANRLAKWMLYTNQTETDVCQFSTGAEGSFLRPGDVVHIQDKLKTSKRYGGRIIDIDYSASTVTLDEGIKEDIVGQKIAFICPKETTGVRTLNKEAQDKLRVVEIGGRMRTKDPSGMSDEELSKSRQTQIKEFTIASVVDTRVVTISEVTDTDFNLIDKGNIWAVNNANTGYEIKPLEYRVLGVVENSQNEYRVTAMMYNRTKFNAIDRSKSLTANQQSQAGSLLVSDLPAALKGEPGQIDYSIVPASLFVEITDAQGNTFYTPEKIIYDAFFPSTMVNFYEANQDGRKMAVDFSGLIGPNNITAKNTGGYLVEVYKDGQKVRFSLDGYDNTSFQVYLGDRNSYRYTDFSIYRYDINYKLESTGLPSI